MREDQDAPTLVDQFRHQGHQQFELGALLDPLRGAGAHQARVAANLTQLEQRVEDDELAATEALAGNLLAHHRVHRRAHRLVEVALSTGKFDRAHDHRFGRQFACHVFLLAAQDERPDAAREQRPPVVVGLLLDRRPPVTQEVGAAAEKPGQEKVELAPQLTKVVLQRRPGQTQAMARLEPAHDLGPLAACILDGLRLVENQQVIAMLGQLSRIAPQQGIRRKHDVMIRNLGETAFALGPVQRKHAQRRGETRCFVAPVEDQRSGQDDQRRTVKAPRFLLEQQMRQGLRGLAQAHVVGQDAGELVPTQKLQPGQAFPLVGAELKPQAAGGLDVGNALRSDQLLGHGHDIGLTVELPAVRVAEFRQTRSVKA